MREGQEAESVICKYVDFLMLTENTCNPDSGNWVKPDIRPCRKNFDDIQQIEWDEDYEDLLNSVQRRTQCSTAYCLHRKGQTDNYSCRFDYPKQCCDDTHIEYEQVCSKDGSLHYKVKVVTKRNDTRQNNHQRLQLQGWRANGDIQVIIHYYSCLEYISKYASKGEKMSTVAKDVYTSVLNDTPNDCNSHNIIKKLMMKAVGQRDMSVQEVPDQLLSIKLVSSSFQVISTSLDGSRRITVQSNLLHTEKSLLDLYAKRDTYECDFPGISNLNFIQLSSSFCKEKLGIA